MKEIKNNSIKKSYRLWVYIASTIILFIIVFAYIFNSKLDLNGDNCEYYLMATSIAGGHGYSDITNEAYNPVNGFPPGYPLLMSVIRIFTDSFFFQKILNGLFLLTSLLLLFFFIRKNKLPDSLAFVAIVIALLNSRVLHFATIMMSETSFFLFSALSLFFLSKMNDEKPFWKDRYFYFAILATAYCYHIRTQGIALAVAIIGFFLFTKRWKQTLAFAGGFVVCLIPWIVRNKIQNLGQSRYLDMVAIANPWRPEEGALSIGEVVTRFLDTFKMLLTQAVPNSILPYFSVDYSSSTTWSGWLIAIILVFIIGIGMWQFGKYKYVLLFYTLATFGVISLFSTPSENRYITALLPFLEISLIAGIYTLCCWSVRRLKIAKTVSPWLFILLAFFSFPRLNQLRAQNTMPVPSNYRHFFTIAKAVHKQLPANTVVCSRKPSLFYMYSQSPVCNYLWTTDNEALIKNLIQSKVDYVVLEQLGYSSTYLYLYPAIQNHPELFIPVISLKKPDTYLLKFDRKKAIEKFQ
ncbi:MAG: phospholipid carrier-dependent glycosyltransferase [Dysgonamonadaceae bacterium]|jgi:hypothetical protein|nr:phospholipid carrier-dependent glycosyltransferase [Dysgonamonadaceae bacterium]